MDYITRSGTVDFLISDHQPIFLLQKKAKNTHPKVQFHGRKYRDYTTEKLHEKIDSILNRDNVLGDPNPAVCWGYLLTTLISIADELTPKMVN